MASSSRRARGAASPKGGSSSSKAAGSPARGPRRAPVVWACFVAAMTIVGGALALAEGISPWSGRSQGALTPLMATRQVERPGPAQAARGDELNVIYSVGRGVAPGRWQAIVIHDSATLVGTPESLDQDARAAGLRSLGYHFVIGNGQGMVDGELYVAPRWIEQQMGAHCAGQNADWFNQQAIGICLVGDGDRERFSPAQVRRLGQLVRSLQERLGIPADRVYLHRELSPMTSPGRLFPEATFRAELLATAGDARR